MKRRAIDIYTGPTTVGVDVSKWQGDIDWARVVQDPQQIRFAVVRTGDGKDTDPLAVRNLTRAHEVGLSVAAYHYFRADRDGAYQRELVREVLSMADVPVLFVAIDIEDGADENLPNGLYPGPRSEKLDPTFVAAEALELIEGVEQYLGERALIYTGQWFHWTYSQARPELAASFGRWPLWVPSHGSTHPRMPVNSKGEGFPWSTWTLHQYTAKGRVLGIDAPVDMNRFRGDYAALLELGRHRPCPAF